VKFITILLTTCLSTSLVAQVQNVKVNTKKNKPNEPSIAINPANPSEIVAAANIDEMYVSQDGGKTWVEFEAKSELGIYGDPVLHYAGNQLLYTHLSKTSGKKYGDWFDRIVVQKVTSLQPWEEKSYSVGFNNGKMQDKPWLSSDEHSMYKGNVYCTWSEFDKYDSKDEEDKSRIRFSKYNPALDEFSDAITISDTVGDCLDGDNTLEGAVSAVGKNGEIFVAWSAFGYLYFDKSLDGGETWGEDKIITEQVNGWDMKMPHIFRANGMPFIHCNTKTNTIYLTFADELEGNGDIWLITSEDGGESWRDRTRLNLDSTSSHHYFPNMAIDQEKDEVYVVYLDQRHSPQNLFYDIYVSSYSKQSGVKEYRITPKSIPMSGTSFFWGDYLDVDIQNRTVAVVYPVYLLGNESNLEVATFQPDQFVPETKKTECAVNAITINGSTKIFVNVQHPYSIKGKISTGYFFKHQAYKFKHRNATNDVDIDDEIASFGTSNVRKLKYKLKNLDTGETFLYKTK
jgi:hypothetical protein